MIDFEKYEKLTQEQFDEVFCNIHSKIMEDPIKNFFEAPGFCNIKLTPAQLVLFKLILNKPLDVTTKYECYAESKDSQGRFTLITQLLTEVELYEMFTEKKYNLENSVQARDISLIVGRRGGKSGCASWLAIYSAIKKNWKPQLGRKKGATILVMSHIKEFSDEIIDEIRSIIEESPILSRLIDKKAKNTQSTINLKVPFKVDGEIVYSVVRIRTNAASSRSSRGSACPFILADEICWWGFNEDSKESDIEIVRAVKPSMTQFGSDATWVALSTPNSKQGVLFEKYEKRFNLPPKDVVLKAASWQFNDYKWNPEIKEEDFIQDFRDKFEEDAYNFSREYRANFSDSSSSFFTYELVNNAVIKGVRILPPEPKKVDVTYIATIDAAFKNDRFVLNITGKTGNRIKQYVSIGFQGTPSAPVKAHKIAKILRELQKQYDFSEIYGDQFCFQPLQEIFQQYGLTLLEKTVTNTFKQKIFRNLKSLLDSRLIDLLDDPITIKELLNLVVEVSDSGLVKIMHLPGFHDDAAFALAMGAFIIKEETVGGSSTNTDILPIVKDYGVKTDINGTCFTAPPAELLGLYIQEDIIDNSDSYKKDPKTGLLVRIDDIDPEDEDDNEDSDGGMEFGF